MRPSTTNAPADCIVCRTPLPIRPAVEGEQADSYPCPKCGTPHKGVLIRQESSTAKPSSQPTAGWTGRLESSATAMSVPSPDRSVLCPLETRQSRRIDSLVDHGGVLDVRPHGTPFSRSIRRHNALPYEPRSVRQVLQTVEQLSGKLDKLFHQLCEGATDSVSTVKTVAGEHLVKAAVDIDLFVCAGINSSDGKYPSQHSLQTAMLAIAIGAQLGWDENSLLDLATGCLIHDVGMQKVARDVHLQPDVLETADFEEVTKHPLYTFELLQDQADRFPVAARLVAYQIHERCDGTGYPRGRTADQIHVSAKIAAVADVFAALVSPRPHRPSLSPYYAIIHLLRDVESGALDARAVRALLEVVSFFPIGSFVELSDGRIAKVIRANGAQYMRPIVQIVADDATPVIVNLIEHDDLKIASPASPPLD